MAAPKKKEESLLSPKAMGVAMLLEFTRSTGTQQLIVVSESEVEGTVRPPMILMRQINEESKRRPWDVRIAQPSNEKDTPTRVAGYLDFYSKWFQTSFASGTWTRKGDPIVVEVSASDLVELGDGRAPQAMIQRFAAIDKLRKEGAE